MALSNQDLYKLLVENQYLPEDSVKKAQQKSITQNRSLYEALLDLDLIADENLGKLIADYLKVPFVVLSKISVDKQVLTIIPEIIASKQRAITFEKTDQTLKIATADPSNQTFFDLVSKKVGLPVSVYFATPLDLEDNLKLYKEGMQKAFDQLLKQQVISATNSKSKEAPVSQIVDTLIDYAYAQKASDIHIEPTDSASLVRFRIDGVLHDEIELPKTLHDQIITRIKVLSRLRTDEHLSAQDGKMQVKLPQEDLDIRVSIVPIVEGEKTVLRLLSSHFRQFSLQDLGISEKDLSKVTSAFNKPFGMILATGPTGSGKTTSIYAILKILNTRDKNIATIEDPVEYDIEGINQIQVNPKTNLTFAEGLRSILRQDPDIIYVGEVRDNDTADIAINSAMTGHLVLSTLHTNDAATSLPRLIDMNIVPFLVSSTVNLIIGQRLVRRICEKCKVSLMKPTTELAKHFNADLVAKYFKSGEEIRLYHGKGCSVCRNSGYIGRVGIFEVMEMTDSLRELITSKASSDVISKKAVEEGMTTMLEDGLIKVQEGITTIEEVLRATKE